MLHAGRVESRCGRRVCREQEAMHLELIVLVLHFCELTFIRLGLEIGFMHTINQTRAWVEINPEETVTGANV